MQQSGGLLLTPVRKLVATLIFAKGKNANKSRLAHQCIQTQTFIIRICKPIANALRIIASQCLCKLNRTMAFHLFEFYTYWFTVKLTVVNYRAIITGKSLIFVQ